MGADNKSVEKTDQIAVTPKPEHLQEYHSTSQSIGFTPSDPFLRQKLKDRYQIEKELGRGGFAVTYLARDFFAGPQSQVSKPVVIKLLLARIAEDEYLQRKFHQEYEALSLINHPYVVSVLDAGTLPDGKPFFVMEYVEGKPLRSIIKEGGIELIQAASLVRQIGQGLTAAHQKGIIHRDLKPENIMLQPISDAEYQVKIIDFGIARVGTSQHGNTTKPLTIGTLGYMAPEQLECKSSTQTDIYALGVIAFELVTGRRPFNPTGDITPVVMFQLHRLQKAGVQVSAKALRTDLPEAAGGAINRALEYHPADRFPVANDFGEFFAQAVMPLPESSQRVSGSSLEVDPTSETVAETEAQFQTLRSLEVIDLLEPVGGAVGLNSKFYVGRPTDQEFHRAISLKDSIVLVKGARQMGKTSLLARGLQHAREAGFRVVFTDLQTLPTAQFESLNALLLVFGQMLEDQLDLDVSPIEIWKPERVPAMNFNRYLRQVVLKPEMPPLVWGLDEVDRLFSCAFAGEMFGLFRSWHNARAGDPHGPWQRLTLAMAYAVEAHLFINDLNQSPFNVGTRLVLSDFTFEQVAELNRRYGEPLPAAGDLNRFYQLVGGQPYLVRLGLHEMVAHQMSLDTFAAQAESDDGSLGDHLKRILLLLKQNADLCEAVRMVLRGQVCTNAGLFYRLRSAGVMVGDAPETMRPRCRIYAQYLKRHLL